MTRKKLGAGRAGRTAPDLPLRLTPWKIYAVWEPIEHLLHRMEVDGTIDVAGGSAVFREDGRGGWYEVVPALEGVIQFHELAEARHGLDAETAGLRRLATKLHHGAPIFPSDLAAARRAIASCKAQAMRLRSSQAADIIDTVRIQMELERLKLAEAA